MEILGGEAASLREAPLPPDPLLPKSGWRLAGLLLHGWFRQQVGRVFGKLGCGHGRRNPSARFAGTSPFRGGFRGDGYAA
mgnify:CR=1 FL=1